MRDDGAQQAGRPGSSSDCRRVMMSSSSAAPCTAPRPPHHIAAHPGASPDGCCWSKRIRAFAFAATALSAGSIRQQFSSPINIAISLYGIEFLRNIGDILAIGDDRPSIGLDEGGYLYLASPAGAAQLAREPGAAGSAGRRYRASSIRTGSSGSFPMSRPRVSQPAPGDARAKAGSTATA